MGDVHGNFGEVNKVINGNRKIKRIFQCGDFGYWPREHGTTYLNSRGKIKYYDQYCLFNKDVIVDWCDGNHEDHHAIIESGYKPDMKNPNTIYHKRGDYITLPDGRNILFMGGAYSIDKAHRVPGRDWFPEETITQKEIWDLPDVRIDIVISHTAPNEFVIRNDMKFTFPHDPSRDALSYILNKYKPSQWYFGHFHTFQHGNDGGCYWTALACAGSGLQWWCELK